MTTVRLRHLAQVNPLTPAFDRLSDGDEVTFLPMEAVWPGSRLDTTRRRTKASVATGYTRFQDGDVLVPKITPTFEAGRSVLISGLLGGVGTGTTELHVVRPGPQIDPRFLLYAVSTHSFLKLGQAEMYGVAGQQRVPDTFLRDLTVALPPLEEQHRIADFLDAETARIDQLIAASHRQFGLISERFTESIRVLTTTAGLGEVTPTGISWMPAMASSWKLMKIGRCFATSSGTTPRSSDANYYDGPHFWVNTGDLRDGAIEQPKKTVTDTALAVYPTLKIYAPESLVVAMYGATTGRVGILKVPACVNQACCVLSELGPLSSRYAFFWFRAHREEVLKLASGGGQPNISQDLVRSLRIPAPSRYEQDEIVDQAESLESMSSRQQHLQVRRAELLVERRQSLITAAVSGQFDVSTASGRNVTDGVTP
ncbi:restriction endonuclease subunit S [Streptomyces albidoflavus]